jgi:capsular exopolysaccharide synthesis family protein
MSYSTTYFGDEGSWAHRYLTALRDHWVLITLLVLIAVLPTAAYSLSAPKRYKAEAALVVTPISANDTTYIGINSLLRDSSQSQAVVTAARLVEAPEVGEAVKSRLRLKKRPEVTVTPLGQSNVVSIVATASSAAGAARAANGYADAAIARHSRQLQREVGDAIKRLDARLKARGGTRNAGANDPIQDQIKQRLAQLELLVGGSDPTLAVLSRAVPPASASWPRPKLSILVALVCSLLLGLGLALAIDLINPVVKDENELLLVHRLPILGVIPRISQRELTQFLTSRRELPPNLREAYRMVRGALNGAGPDGSFPRVILVSSAGVEEGKTVTSIGLATAIARSGMSVILVDGDLRNPMLSAVFGASPGRVGLPGVLRGTTTAEGALVPTLYQNLRLLLSTPDPAAVDDLQRDRVAAVLRQLRRHADVVVIDSSPMGEFADAYAFADAAEALIVCARLGRTNREAIRDLLRRLAQLRIAPTGVVAVARRRTFGTAATYGQRRPVDLPTASAARPHSGTDGDGGTEVLTGDGEARVGR